MNRVVVVSGGGTGIGRAVSHAFAADNDQIVLIGRREGVLSDAAGALAARHPNAPAAVVYPADLTDPQSVAALAETIARDLGQVDVIVNAAGGNPSLNADAQVPDGLAGIAWHWTQNFKANTLTAALLIEGLRDHLVNPGGRVIMISSIAAYRGSGTGSYAGSKAALHPYAFDLAASLGPRGATVNIVAPGYIADTEFFQGRMTAEREHALIDQTHTGRAGTPDDVAQTVHWLASPAAAHITGQIVQVNGGAEQGR